jgi:hypothetical protein
VRPVEHEGRVRIPLGIASASERAVEVVIVQERKLLPGRSTVDLSLAQVGWPVLRHDWRLLLPERNRYRYAGGALRPARAQRGGTGRDEPASGAFTAPRTRSVRMGAGGSASIHGVVTDHTGGILPGASVSLVSNATGQRLELVTDQRGEFQFAGLAPGSYALTTDLAGFKRASYRAIGVSSGQTRGFSIVLEIGEIAETVTVSAEPDSYRRAPSAKDEQKAVQQAAEAAQFQSEIGALRQGLVGGVKPVPVKIPESGKVLTLAGALPPPQVTVSLEVKAPKD